MANLPLLLIPFSSCPLEATLLCVIGSYLPVFSEWSSPSATFLFVIFPCALVSEKQSTVMGA